MKKILIFLGPPGSGKGTQAKRVAEKYFYKHVSTGDILRGLAKQSVLNNAQKEAVNLMKEGKLVPDETIFAITFKAIDDMLKKSPGIVLDGAIRTLRQAEAFEKHFVEQGYGNEVAALLINLSDEEAVKRLAGRRVCKHCGEIIPSFDQQTKLCPRCGGELMVRPDDSVAVVQKRIELQGNRALEPIVSFYKKNGQLAEVDGTKTIEEVEKAIENFFESV